LFWQGTKSALLWVQLLNGLDIRCVVDLTPGSWSLAVVCVQVGIAYFGMRRRPAHMGWLNNVLYRACLKYLCEAGGYLYQEELAQHIKKVFASMRVRRSTRTTQSASRMPSLALGGRGCAAKLWHTLGRVSWFGPELATPELEVGA